MPHARAGLQARAAVPGFLHSWLSGCPVPVLGLQARAAVPGFLHSWLSRCPVLVLGYRHVQLCLAFYTGARESSVLMLVHRTRPSPWPHFAIYSLENKGKADPRTNLKSNAVAHLHSQQS